MAWLLHIYGQPPCIPRKAMRYSFQSISLMKCSTSVKQGETGAATSKQPQFTCGVEPRWRRETCWPEHRGWPADIFNNKTLWGKFAFPVSDSLKVWRTACHSPLPLHSTILPALPRPGTAISSSGTAACRPPEKSARSSLPKPPTVRRERPCFRACASGTAMPWPTLWLLICGLCAHGARCAGKSR